MKNCIYFVMIVMLTTLALGCTTETTVEEEKKEMPAAGVNVLLENDEVRVVEATRSPGTKVPMHTHPKFLAYYFSATTVKLTSPEGKETVKDVPAGKLLWFPNGVTHALEVIGPADQHVLVIEMKK